MMYNINKQTNSSHDYIIHRISISAVSNPPGANSIGSTTSTTLNSRLEAQLAILTSKAALMVYPIGSNRELEMAQDWSYHSDTHIYTYFYNWIHKQMHTHEKRGQNPK